MTWPVELDVTRISLNVPNRVSGHDAARQMNTAEAILRRLGSQPGLVLADEVGMGKTFVALAVAASVAWADKGRNPVVVMVPSSLKSKWPRDFDVFRTRCVRQSGSRSDRSITAGLAEDGVAFLKMLDDPLPQRKQIIFLTHGALSRDLRDPWTKLAILKSALRSRRLSDQRRVFHRFAGEILRVASRFNDDLFGDLMLTRAAEWRGIIARYDTDPGDDPVPARILRVLDKRSVDLGQLENDLRDLPLRDSANRAERLTKIRRTLVGGLREVWNAALKESRFFSPLLILDEAHHLKNPKTALASLFVAAEAEEDAKALQGALEGRFERMLFLTATPFQLGHHELLNVLRRFGGIRWKDGSPTTTADQFQTQIEQLQARLDAAQHASLALEQNWSTLRPEDILQAEGPADWWDAALARPAEQTERVQSVLRLFGACSTAMRGAEELLRPWVIRHVRNRYFPDNQERRRQVRPGAAILEDGSDREGLTIGEEALLPFLLVARSQAVASSARDGGLSTGVKRLTFVEGLASSYEAYRETRAASDEGRSLDALCDEEVVGESRRADGLLQRYLNELRIALPGEGAAARHPKIAPTVGRVLDLWKRGEKVLVFCHFRATGRALEKHILNAISTAVRITAATALRCEPAEVDARLTAIGDSLDSDRPAGRFLDGEVQTILERVFSFSDDHRQLIAEVIRRFVRTSSFLVRYFPLDERDPVERIRIALDREDDSGLALRQKLEAFVQFLEDREEERSQYLEALRDVQTARNVRRATGEIDDEQRRRLLLSFNTPFFPEVLIASSVLAEGVDLHLDCRHVIHHDLSWNPSTLEQRTGRVDRIGAKAERVHRSIDVFLPYLGGTQDEKMYRVVRDRERWFQVLMGEQYQLEERQQENIEERVPLPESAARMLAFKLDVT